MTNKKTILIVDDEAEVRSLIADVLQDEGYNTLLAANESEAFQQMKKQVPTLIFLDLWIGEDESAGLKSLEKIKKQHPDMPVIMISGHGTIDVAVQAIQKGAFDFIEKPFVIDRLVLTCQRGIELAVLTKENLTLKNNKFNTDVMAVGTSTFPATIKSLIEKISNNNSRVLINAQSGLGADSVAFDIHKKSSRKDFHFVYVNCVSDDEAKFEEELFGTEKSYGYIEKADNGTLYLEEINKLSKNTQRKLLQFLKEDRYSVSGRTVFADVRIICSSSDDLDFLKQADNFNNELLYRLNIININIPSINNRREDIFPLIEYYLTNAALLFGLKAKQITSAALAILQSYSWPGNIYQVKNVIESSLINAHHSDVIDKQNLPSELTVCTKEKLSSLSVANFISLPIKEATDRFEADYLTTQLERFSGNISKTAQFIHMERSALHRKLKNLGVHSEKKKSS